MIGSYGRLVAPRISDDWQQVCDLDSLEFERGVTALVHGPALALFRAPDGTVHALGNHDPFDRSSSIAKGIMGLRQGIRFVAPPTHKQRFNVETGQCLDDPQVWLPVYEVTVTEGKVYVGSRISVSAA